MNPPARIEAAREKAVNGREAFDLPSVDRRILAL
jgi:hypothetical protein